MYKNYFKGKNFMTPNIVSYGKRKSHIYEISNNKSGSIYPLTIMWGLTVKTLDGKHSELSRCFFSEKELKNYIKMEL